MELMSPFGKGEVRRTGGYLIIDVLSLFVKEGGPLAVGDFSYGDKILSHSVTAPLQKEHKCS